MCSSQGRALAEFVARVYIEAPYGGLLRELLCKGVLDIGSGTGACDCDRTPPLRLGSTAVRVVHSRVALTRSYESRCVINVSAVQASWDWRRMCVACRAWC